MRAEIDPSRSIRPIGGAVRAVAVVLALGPAAAPASAGETPPSRTRQAVTQPPPKDCTRFNGRFGYYGNPWCSPAEQARWDRWEAARLKALGR